jgi:hypothetical protein
MNWKMHVFIFFALLLNNCDLLSPDPNGEIEFSGLIINESTGNTIPNLGINLKMGSSSWGGYEIVESAITDKDGKFHLKYDAKNYRNSLHVYINDEPYMGRYSTSNFSIMPGDKIEKDVKIFQNTTLKVKMSSAYPLNKKEYTLWLPGLGTSVDTALTTHHAKGNFYNEVRLVYNRNGEYHEISDSVYCPINEVTTFILTY